MSEVEKNPLNYITEETLMTALLGKLYGVLTAGSDSEEGAREIMSKRSVFAWNPIGQPVKPEDFGFIKKGFKGTVDPKKVKEEIEFRKKAIKTNKTGSNNDGANSINVDEIIKRMEAENLYHLYSSAFNLFNNSDGVFDMSAIDENHMQTLVSKIQTGNLSDVYKRVLINSQVADYKISDEEKKQIENFRKLLEKEVEEEDIDMSTGKIVKKKVLVPSDLVNKYNLYMQAYIDAEREYNKAAIEANSSTDIEAIHNWTMNANILRNKVKYALSQWESIGKKSMYEKITNYISQIESRSISLLKEEYLDTMRKTTLTDLSSKSEFLYTTLASPSFFESGGWTNLKFSKSDYENHYKNTKTRAGGGGGIRIGIFKLGGGGGKTTHEVQYDMSSSNFKLSFEVCEVPIVRPWFKSSFLNSRCWRFAVGGVYNSDILSDGNIPPSEKSLLPAYATSMIFIRNLKLDFGTREANEKYKEEIIKGHGEVSLNWGIFRIDGGGGYKKTESTSDYKSRDSSQGIEVNGMQLIGYRCHLLPKSPDPNPEIKDWI